MAARWRRALCTLGANKIRNVSAATRILDLSASSELICDNLMCEKVGELCLCRFSIALPKLRGITDLRLSGNGIDRWPEVWRLHKLQRLDLSHNRLTHVPAEVGTLRELKELNLAYNALTSLPDDLLRALPMLELIDVRGNEGMTPPRGLSATVLTT